MEEHETNKIQENYDLVKDEFKKLIQDFIKDLLITFPELDDKVDKTLIMMMSLTIHCFVIILILQKNFHYVFLIFYIKMKISLNKKKNP